MPIVDQKGRVFALVNIIDFLAAVVVIAVVAAGSRLVLSESVAGLLTAAVAVVGLGGLVLVSKWYHDVSWGTVRTAIQNAQPSWPSRPSLRGLRRWWTVDPSSEVVVTDLRDTLTLGPIVLAIDRIADRTDDDSHDSTS